MGLAYRDSSIEAGKEYLYTAELNDIPAGKTQSEGYYLLETNEILALPIPPKMEVQPLDSAVLLSWDKSGLGSSYTSFMVEKSSDGGQTFQQVNSRPFRHEHKS